jgi:DNA-3-methyladenine glycosylase I
MGFEKQRCDWVRADKPHYIHYHDEEWGKAVHDDRHLFEMLVLEGAQAGLSWETILKRRDGYRKAFKNFEPSEIARNDGCGAFHPA